MACVFVPSVYFSWAHFHSALLQSQKVKNCSKHHDENGNECFIGPATNLFASLVLLILLGGIAGHFATGDQSIHVKGIVKGEGADNAGMLPWDTIETINGTEIVGLEGFRDAMDEISAGDWILIGVLHDDGTRETVNATLSDKYTYYQDLGYSEEQLETLSVSPGDPFGR